MKGKSALSKTLALYSGLLARGGAERVTINLAAYFRVKKYNVIIYINEHRQSEYAIPQGVCCVCLNERGSSYVEQVKTFRRSLKTNRVDCLIVMGSPLTLYAVPACVGLDTKVIISERNDPEHFGGRAIVKYVSRFMMKMADGFVFQTEEAESFFSPDKPSSVIPNPLSSQGLPKPHLDGTRKKEIVAVGRLNPQKNQKLLIGAFSKIANKYPEYQLIIYGEGVLREELESLIRRSNMEGRIKLPGVVANVVNRIVDSSVFVMTSDFEGMPNALMEAMSIGLPCISTDCPCGGPRYLIKNNFNGILIPVGDEEKLINALRVLLDNHRFAEKLGREATEIRYQLSIEKIGSKWESFLRVIIGEQ